MATRVFFKLSAGGFAPTNVNKLAPGDVIQVEDDDVVVGFAADAVHGDPQTYIVSQVQRVVQVPVRTATGVRAQEIAFTG